MTTQMVPHNNQSALATSAPAGMFGVEGMEDLRPSDFAIPRKKMVQPSIRRQVPNDWMGKFLDSITDEVSDVLIAAILRISHSALKFTGDMADQSPECTSTDGISGTKHGACARCQFNPEVHSELWKIKGQDAKAKRCNRGLTLLCWDAEKDEMFLLGIYGSSVGPLKIFNTKLLRALKGRPTCAVYVKFETKLIVDQQGKYYVLSPSVHQDVPADKVAEYRETAQAMRGQALAAFDEESAAPADDTVEPAPLLDDEAPVPVYETQAGPKYVPPPGSPRQAPQPSAKGQDPKTLF